MARLSRMGFYDLSNWLSKAQLLMMEPTVLEWYCYQAKNYCPKRTASLSPLNLYAADTNDDRENDLSRCLSK